MAITFLDPAEAAAVRSLIVTNGGTSDERRTEVWEGVEVVPPIPNDEHQELVGELYAVLHDVLSPNRAGKVRPGVIVSDRATGWRHNYCCPDVVAYLPTNPAINHGAHWQGGPDFLVEILSPGEDPYAKFDFYAAVNTREVLLVFRDPWAVELHQLKHGRLEAAGRSDLASPVVLTSGVLPLTFRLRAASPRPVIDVAHATDGRTWTA